jgi:predicted nucleic acid-binding protein
VTPSYLVDTSAWNRSGHVAQRWSELLEAGELALCVPVRLELLWSARSPSEYGELAQELSGFRSLPIDASAETAAARAQAELADSSHHRGPRPIDLLIAAIAQAHGVTVLHYDQHFDLIASVTDQQAEWIAPPGALD